MVKKQYLVMAAATFFVGVFAIYHFYFDEEAKVKQRFKLLGERISKQGEESKLIAAVSINKALSLFAQNIQLEIPSRSISRTYDRRDLSAPIFMNRSRYSEIDLQFYDYKIKFLDAGTAEVNVTLDLKAKGISGEYRDEIQELICSLSKNKKDDWAFHRIEVVEVLEK